MRVGYGRFFQVVDNALFFSLRNSSLNIIQCVDERLNTCGNSLDVSLQPFSRRFFEFIFFCIPSVSVACPCIPSDADIRAESDRVNSGASSYSASDERVTSAARPPPLIEFERSKISCRTMSSDFWFPSGIFFVCRMNKRCIRASSLFGSPSGPTPSNANPTSIWASTRLPSSSNVVPKTFIRSENFPSLVFVSLRLVSRPPTV